MKKLTLLTLLAVAVNIPNTFAHDDHKTKKKLSNEKCVKGGDCCKKGTSKAAMMKAAKPAAKTAAKKA
ncbi:hypothetical protein [Mucilaginibacter myungsuensis]|uniref:Pentapeptide MXKDX repeat protein n=1 Tax=Mucilaginibacter myungsuensis TaxID=649104 RepID=A0A929KZV0_9SPHI|nr:hypothetical protein [Mucilaginibacter myungsuensis]MBE9661590.1 hypothetical protein [Mucilaginibacter myungsuensis]MDN3597735.1 hypothetical protein [Mucilaginibacter myungsuensis]